MTEAAIQQDLRRLSREALDALFDTLPAPAVGELRGEYPGEVLSGALPAPLGGIAARLWRAKSFSGADGINHWRVGRPRLPFRVHLEAAAYGSGEVLVLDYDLAGNPRPARRVRGELRRLGRNAYLGRMLVWQDSYRLVAYFALRGAGV
ncbi:MAG: hypothetical protein K0U79_11860 [Gammaproteobacteria bacterium]|nr:hypothetical protein [Gammaproteobacteria bacterium]